LGGQQQRADDRTRRAPRRLARGRICALPSRSQRRLSTPIDRGARSSRHRTLLIDHGHQARVSAYFYGADHIGPTNRARRVRTDGLPFVAPHPSKPQNARLARHPRLCRELVVVADRPRRRRGVAADRVRLKQKATSAIVTISRRWSNSPEKNGGCLADSRSHGGDPLRFLVFGQQRRRCFQTRLAPRVARL